MPESVEVNTRQSHPTALPFLIDQSMDSASGVSLGTFIDERSVPFSDCIVSLPSPDYTLRRPIVVTVDYEEDYYIVGDDRFLRYGIGSTVAEAKENYAHSLLEYYKDLSELEECLAPHLVRDLKDLRKIMASRESE
ncbi:MAG: hypothetical protein ACE5IF_04275 [Candidatus Bathyarchaeia archaeon]